MEMRDKGEGKEELTFMNDGRKIGPNTLPLRNSDPLTSQPRRVGRTKPQLQKQHQATTENLYGQQH